MYVRQQVHSREYRFINFICNRAMPNTKESALHLQYLNLQFSAKLFIDYYNITHNFIHGNNTQTTKSHYKEREKTH